MKAARDTSLSAAAIIPRTAWAALDRCSDDAVEDDGRDARHANAIAESDALRTS